MAAGETKAFLRRYRDIDLRIGAKLAEIQRLRSIAARTAPSQNGGSGGKGGKGDRVGAAAAKIADIDAEINDEIDKLYQVRGEIQRAIDALPDEKQRVCIELRYIGGLRFDQIAAKMGYDVRHIHRIHGSALAFLSKNLKMSLNVT